MGLVGDDDVKALDRDGRVVANGFGIFEQCLNPFGAFFVCLLGQFTPLEHAEHALYGADNHAGAGVELVALQVLDYVFLAKLVVVVGAGVGVKLFFGLAGEVAPVHQEKHASRTAKLNKAVDEANAGKRLAAARGHLDQCLWLVGGEAFLQIGDSADLGRPQLVVRTAASPLGDELGHMPQPSEEGACGFLRIDGARLYRQINQPLH